jgi:hypothetical protein
MKNRIINGAMVIDQRNAGASVTITTAAEFGVDRWRCQASANSKLTLQQNAGSVTPPVGFTNYLGATSLSAYTVGASESFSIAQYIEGFNTADLGWGTANAKTVTLSFWVYSSLTGTFSGALANSAVSRSYPFSYSIPVANTWTQISITIVGDTSGTWIGATNGIGLRVWINLGAGSSLSNTAGSWAGGDYRASTGSVSVVGTNGATFYITGVQLEVGSSATGFEYRQYGQELALCQRYYTQFNSGGGYSTSFGSGYCDTSTNVNIHTSFPVQMRGLPTITSSAGSTFYVQSTAGTGCTGFAALFAGYNGMTNRFVASGQTAGQGALMRDNNTTSAFLGASAEL